VQIGSSRRTGEPHGNYTTSLRYSSGGADFDSSAVRQSIAGFLAGYSDTTRDADSLDLRQWLGWWTSHELWVFAVRRAHVELFARSLEQDGQARATVAPLASRRRSRPIRCGTRSSPQPWMPA